MSEQAHGSSAERCTASVDGHAMVTHVRGGAPVSVRRCSLCGWIDFGDLGHQVAELVHGHPRPAGPVASDDPVVDAVLDGFIARHCDLITHPDTGEVVFSPEQAKRWLVEAQRVVASLRQDGYLPHLNRRLVESDVEPLAALFHATYERLAPQYGYETRAASAVPWDRVPENTRRLMVATVAEVLLRRPDIPAGPSPLDAVMHETEGEPTVRMYLLRMLLHLWQQGANFNAKRPYGYSGWRVDVAQAVVDAGLVGDDSNAYVLVDQALTELAEQAIPDLPRERMTP